MLRILLVAAILLPASLAARAQSCSLPANATQQQITTALGYAQSNTCTGTTNGRWVQLAAGTTTIASSINVPCGGSATTPITISGPIVANNSSPTAILNGTPIGANGYIMSTSSCVGLTVQDIQFQHAGGIDFSGGDNSYVSILNDQFLYIPDIYVANPNCCNGVNAVNIIGGFANALSGTAPNQWIENIDQNFTFKYNTFGDSTTCPNTYAGYAANGTNCVGILVYTATAKNFDIEYNWFNHIPEGIHFLANGPEYSIGALNSGAIGTTIEHNYFTAQDRIALEIQMNTPYDSPQIMHNAVDGTGGCTNSSPADCGGAGSGGPSNFNYSIPCCQWGWYDGTAGYSGSATFQDNIAMIRDTADYAPYGVEFWGNAPLGANSLIEGYIASTYTYGYWATSNGLASGTQYVGTIEYNYLCGPGSITNEEGYDPPNEIGNVTSSTCAAQTSVAPVITPAAGAQSFPLTVTVSVPVNTNNVVSGMNTSIYYTTDGSTPTTSSTLYTGPITLQSAGTVKAIGQWGVAPQPTSWPSGYGYVPSAVQSATYTASGGSTILGTQQNSDVAQKHANYIASNYFVVGSQPVTPTSCSIYVGSGTTGDQLTCGIIAAPSPTTEASSYLCYTTITNPGVTDTVLTGQISGCGTLPAGGTYWVTVNTNDPNLTTGYWNCGGTCGTNPNTPSTYGQAYVPSTYGVYTGLPTTLEGTGGAQQVTLYVTATTTGGSTILGTQQNSDVAQKRPSYIASNYFVVGSQPVTPTSCSVYVGSGTTGDQLTCGIIAAPSPTTEASSYLCYATITNPGVTDTVLTGQISGCGTLPAGGTYWVTVNTNDPNLTTGYWNCGGTCSTSPSNPSTYGQAYVPSTYGVYTGLPTTLEGTGGAQQVTLYITATTD